jgi:hypothetical protein
VCDLAPSPLIGGIAGNGIAVMVDTTLPIAPAGTNDGVASARSRFTTDLWVVRVVLVWLIVVTLLLVLGAKQIAAGRFNDPDDALRLMEVRDLLAGQGWFDLHQYRVAPPGGVLMHWSRLVDIPLAGMIVMLRPLLGPALAETVTLVAIPLLTLLAAMLLIGRLTAKFFTTETVAIGGLVTAIATPLIMQMMPMRIDHHGWQIVLALAALNGLAARNAWRGGLVIGVALAALLAVSIEGLPLTAVFLGTLALRGLTGRGYGGLATACAALALASGAIFLTTRGLGDLGTHCDQISPIHLALFAMAAVGTGGMVVINPRRWPVGLAMLGATALAALGLYLGAAPQCRGGAFVVLDPLVRTYWYENISEGLPFWHMPLMAAIELLGVPLVGLFAVAMQWRDSQTPQAREWWVEYALVLGGALVIGGTLARAAATACALAAVPTSALILRWIIALREARPVPRVAGYMGILMVLMPPLPVMMWAQLVALHSGKPAANGMPMPTQCSYAEAARALNQVAPTTMFTPLDIGPDLLVRTQQRTVATGHHRGAAGMHDVMAAFLGKPDEARAIVARHHATLIVVCPDTAEPANYKSYAPNGFMAQLLRGKPPGWLDPVDLAPASHMLFWRVKG